ncbi:MAG: GTPase Era [Myxococcales bacterium]|nr:GTPase Era [Myxococcales bacterium]
MRFGSVALIGRTNVGKSTFLNAALGESLAVVSPVPQTTREALLGVVHRPDAQIAFVDTPGLHRPKSELGRRMNATALEVARSADVLVVMTDLDPKLAKDATATVTRDREVIELLPKGPARLLVVNKVDLVRDKQKLLPILTAYEALHDFAALVPVSLKSAGESERVLDAIVALLPEGEEGFEADTLTDRATPYFVREYVREQVLALAKGEVPHAVAVSIDAIEERERVLAVKATIHVEKEGQRRILIGKGGASIKAIGTGARKRLEELLDRKLFLELFVRVTPKWKHVPRQLAELGYEAPREKNLLGALPDAPKRKARAKR